MADKFSQEYNRNWNSVFTHAIFGIVYVPVHRKSLKKRERKVNGIIFMHPIHIPHT